MRASWGEIARRTRLPWAAIERQQERVRRQREEELRGTPVAIAHRVDKIERDSPAQRVTGWMTDEQLRDVAIKRADMMMGMVAAAQWGARADVFKRLGEIVASLDARPIIDKGQDMTGVFARVCCPVWWVRQLKRASVLHRERQGRNAGEVCARKRQPYLTDDTVRRMQQRDRRNVAMLEQTEIESADGDVITLAQAAAASVSNPALRRGELMTRIKGCDEWATAHGWVGLFTTHTTPSRFHAAHHDGSVNAKWDAAGRPTPRDGQDWLCKTWARTRAKLQRLGLEVFGFRVAEPHHDGTPHWHMLVWCKPSQRDAVAEVMRAYWLADSGEEKGAAAHRFTAKEMWPGGAAGYIAKYIAKGIDDEGEVGAAGHYDDLPEGRRMVMEQDDMFGGGAQRVRMWARANGIRQFQAIGQPPVTVWRELRRVEEAQAYRGTDRVWQAWMAVNREGERRASWSAYMAQQGGACQGKYYLLRLAVEERTTQGRYETVTEDKPVGVIDLLDEREQVVRSVRKEWKPRGEWGPRANSQHVGGVYASRAPACRAVHPWTRVNNCTGARPIMAGVVNHENQNEAVGSDGYGAGGPSGGLRWERHQATGQQAGGFSDDGR